MKNLYCFFSLFTFLFFPSFNAVLAQEVDTIPPVVTLIGVVPIVIPCNGTYIEFGAEAIDDVDGVLDVTIGGDCVCTVFSGSYVVTYTATDSSGNSTTEPRLVIVQGDCNGECHSLPPCNEEYGPPTYVAKDDFTETPINTPIEIPVLENEFIYNYDILYLKAKEILMPPIHGTATIINEKIIRYEPNLGFIGTDSLVYRASNNAYLSDSAIVIIEVGTTSIQTNSTFPFLQVYPNPAKDFLTIEVGKDLTAKQNLQLILFNTVGQLQLIQDVSNIRASTIDIEGLQRGLYLFQLKEKNGEMLANGKVLVE